jgi:chromosome segregation ATPase
VKKPKEVVKKEIEVVIDPKTGIIRKKAVNKKVIPHNLEDLKKIKGMKDEILKKIKGMKDEIEALKTRMVRKDATIKNLKRKVEKLKEEIERPEKEKREEREFYIENPDFLEIN